MNFLHQAEAELLMGKGKRLRKQINYSSDHRSWKPKSCVFRKLTICFRLRLLAIGR